MNIVLILALLAMSAFFSATETAFSCVNKIRLKNYAANGNKRAEMALKIANDFDKALTAILIGNNIVNILSASIGTVLFTQMFGANGVGISTAVMTVLVLIFGEILPKSLAKENAESFALNVAGVLRVMMLILTPAIWFFTWIRKGFSKLFAPKSSSVSITEDELKYIIEEIEEQGVLEEQESDLVRSALEFDEITVDEILVPRVNVVGVEISDSVEEIKQIFMAERYSRLPVYEKSIDNIVGIIHEKDLFRLVMEGGTNISEIIQKTMYISDLKLISETLHDMQKNKMHFAVVVDQHGGTKGIVTLEDILEELVGEIYDEADEADMSFVPVGENKYEVLADLNVHDMLEKLELTEDVIEIEGVSVGGWVCELLGKIPDVNETAEQGIFKITVLSADEQRVKKILLEVDVPCETDTEE